MRGSKGTAGALGGARDVPLMVAHTSFRFKFRVASGWVNCSDLEVWRMLYNHAVGIGDRAASQAAHLLRWRHPHAIESWSARQIRTCWKSQGRQELEECSVLPPYRRGGGGEVRVGVVGILWNGRRPRNRRERCGSRVAPWRT